MFVFIILEKFKETRFKFSQGDITILQEIVNHQEFIVTLTKSAAKNKAETILKLNQKNFEDGELLHKLFLTTRQTAKIRNTFAKSMSADIKLSKAQITKKNSIRGRFWFLVKYLRKEGTNKYYYFFS